MTPGARVAAAIDILHDMNDGLAAEQALTRWARRSRFAGSKDRAAIRDHVFDVLRCKPLAAHYGKAPTPRALMIGSLYLQSADLAALFSGEGHAPAPLNLDEQIFPEAPADAAAQLCLPAWLVPLFEAALGDKTEETAKALQARAPIVLRVNVAKAPVSQVQEMLASDGVKTRPNGLCDTALTVVDGARRIRNTAAYLEGFVELQDAASQAVAAAVPPGGRCLDYCAGGGGKALALVADATRDVFAHDIDPRRMADLPARAARAGTPITQIATEDLAAAAPFDIVLCDAPCSGSGAWRRSPEGKWNLTHARLTELTALQDEILDEAASMTAPEGVLVYATCSILREENEDRIAAYLARHPGWSEVYARRYTVDDEGDGFFTAHLKMD